MRSHLKPWVSRWHRESHSDTVRVERSIQVAVAMPAPPSGQFGGRGRIQHAPRVRLGIPISSRQEELHEATIRARAHEPKVLVVSRRVAPVEGGGSRSRPHREPDIKILLQHEPALRPLRTTFLLTGVCQIHGTVSSKLFISSGIRDAGRALCHYRISKMATRSPTRGWHRLRHSGWT